LAQVIHIFSIAHLRTQVYSGYGYGSEYTLASSGSCISVLPRLQMIRPGALAGLFPAVLVAVFLFSPVAVGLSIADDHGSAQGRVRAGPDGDFDDGLGPYEGGPVDGEPDTHVYDFEKKDIASPLRSYRNFPRNGRVAIVLRGATFRSFQQKQMMCVPGDAKAEQMQKDATQSLVSNVIVPLEQAGNTVDVIVADLDCNLTRTHIVHEWIGEQRVKALGQNANKSMDQNRNVKFALDLLANYSGGTEAVAAKYSHVFVMRHDTAWTKPMNGWLEADFSKVLFPFKCPWSTASNSVVHDLFFLLPAQYFKSFYGTIEQRKCFFAADGHGCLQAMVWWRGEDSVDVAVHYREGVELPWYTKGKARATC